MSTLSAAARVVPVEDGLRGECSTCGLTLSCCAEFDRDVAVGTFLQHHPASPEAMHRQGVPPGWHALPS